MKLSVVSTPIGNLEDITLRALRILKEVNVIACEDTRMTKKLLAHFDIHTPTIAFHANSGQKGFEKIIRLLQEDTHVALVCDAGTPGVSDPGLELVSRIREALPDARIETIPGASALTAALSIAGMRVSTFIFYGFPPQKKGRETLFRNMAQDTRASVFYESPHRVRKALESLAKYIEVNRRIGIFRELTKLHEDSFVGTVQDALIWLLSDVHKEKGEFVILIEEV